MNKNKGEIFAKFRAIIINLRGTDLAIRKKDAELIFIKEAV